MYPTADPSTALRMASQHIDERVRGAQAHNAARAIRRQARAAAPSPAQPRNILRIAAFRRAVS